MVKRLKQKWWQTRASRKGRDDLFRERVRSVNTGDRPTRSQPLPEIELDETQPCAYPHNWDDWRYEPDWRTDVYGWGHRNPIYSYSTSSTTGYNIQMHDVRWYNTNSSSSIREWYHTFRREHNRVLRVQSLDPYIAIDADAPRADDIRQAVRRMNNQAARRMNMEGAQTFEQERAQRAAAALKAEALLLRMLDDDQRRMYERDKCFIIVSQRGRRYLIHRGRQHNVFLLPTVEMLTVFKELRMNTKILELCVHLSGRVPDEDNILAQKLWLETNEDEFLRQANIWDWTAIGQNRPIVSHEGETFDPGRTSVLAQHALRIQQHETESGLIVAA